MATRSALVCVPEGATGGRKIELAPRVPAPAALLESLGFIFQARVLFAVGGQSRQELSAVFVSGEDNIVFVHDQRRTQALRGPSAHTSITQLGEQ